MKAREINGGQVINFIFNITRQEWDLEIPCQRKLILRGQYDSWTGKFWCLCKLWFGPSTAVVTVFGKEHHLLMAQPSSLPQLLVVQCCNSTISKHLPHQGTQDSIIWTFVPLLGPLWGLFGLLPPPPAITQCNHWNKPNSPQNSATCTFLSFYFWCG